jgi:hypothetical protein
MSGSRAAVSLDSGSFGSQEEAAFPTLTLGVGFEFGMILEHKVNLAALGSGKRRKGAGEAGRKDVGGDAVSHVAKNILAAGAVTSYVQVDMMDFVASQKKRENELKGIEGAGEATDKDAGVALGNIDGNGDGVSIYLNVY